MNESEHAAVGGLAAALSQVKRAHPERRVQMLLVLELDYEGATIAAELPAGVVLSDFLQKAADRARELGK